MSISVARLSISVATLSNSVPRLSISVARMSISVATLSNSVPRLSTSVPRLSISVATLSNSVPRLSISVATLSNSVPRLSFSVSSLLLFHKIHCGAVSIEKDKYMTPAHSLKTTRSSHGAQYRRHQIYSDALKNSFFPRTIPHWNSLPPSVANAQSTEEFRALLI